MLEIINLGLLTVIAYSVLIQRRQIEKLLGEISEHLKTDSQRNESTYKAEMAWQESITAEIQRHIDRQNEVSAQVEAFVLALKRINSIENMCWIYAHYTSIKEWLYLRRKGVSEEEIAFKYMQYEEPGMLGEGGQGFSCPQKSTDGKWYIAQVAPYYVAVNGFNFPEMERLSKERHMELSQTLKSMPEKWSEFFEPADTPRSVWGTWLINSKGEFMYYPTGEIDKEIKP